MGVAEFATITSQNVGNAAGTGFCLPISQTPPLYQITSVKNLQRQCGGQGDVSLTRPKQGPGECAARDCSARSLAPRINQHAKANVPALRDMPLTYLRHCTAQAGADVLGASYANALVELASEADELEKVHQDMDALASVLAENSDVRSWLAYISPLH